MPGSDDGLSPPADRPDACGVEFIIIGGFAATAHGSAHVTVDLDIVYRRTADNIERLARALATLRPYLRGAPPSLPFQLDVQTFERGKRELPEPGWARALIGFGDRSAFAAAHQFLLLRHEPSDVDIDLSLCGFHSSSRRLRPPSESTSAA